MVLVPKIFMHEESSISVTPYNTRRIQSKYKMQFVTALKKMNWNQNRYRKGMLGWSEGWKDYQMIDSKDLDLAWEWKLRWYALALCKYFEV